MTNDRTPRETALDRYAENKFAARVLWQRISCAQDLRAGVQPETGALNDVQPRSEEDVYAPLN